jgi:hypothetical protein
MSKDLSKYVQEYTDDNGATRYVIAFWSEKCVEYQAPMTPRGCRLSGCHTMVARHIGDVVSSYTYTYARRSDALRQARKLYGDDMDEVDYSPPAGWMDEANAGYDEIEDAKFAREAAELDRQAQAAS